MGYLDCPVNERDESVVVQDKDVMFINNNHKNQFKFWCEEKGEQNGR